MKTVVIGQRPAELDEVIARRHALGQDTHDEVWEGDYHMAPAAHHWHGIVQGRLLVALDPHVRRAGLVASMPFNLGTPDNYRVPDLGITRGELDSVWLDTAAVVVEVVSPEDESWDKLDFYAERGVEEVLIADPVDRTITIVVLGDGRYQHTDASRILGITANELQEMITWPTA